MADGPSVHVPAPPKELGKWVGQVIWPQDRVIHRIHLHGYAGAEFNPGIKGNARFSPITNRGGAPIPTLYGGSTLDCAGMETVFHDVPFSPGLKTFDKNKLNGQVHSMLVPLRDLVLADLSVTALRRLGVTRPQLIDTEKDQYPQTRKWAEAIHAARPDVDGLCWVSRQDDRAEALILFGDRVSSDTLAARGEPQAVIDGDIYLALAALAERIGLKIV